MKWKEEFNEWKENKVFEHDTPRTDIDDAIVEKLASLLDGMEKKLLDTTTKADTKELPDSFCQYGLRGCTNLLKVHCDGCVPDTYDVNMDY